MNRPLKYKKQTIEMLTFQVLEAASTKMADSQRVEPCSLVDVRRRFRDVAFMIEAPQKR